MKKNRKLLVFTIFSLFSIKSFAEDVEIGEKVTVEENNKKNEENFDDILDELEEIDKNAVPNYASKIFFSLPFNLGFNYPIKNNEKEKKEEFSFIGSRSINFAFFVNFPLPIHHFFVSAGAELGNNSFYWEGDRNICKFKTLSDDNDKLLKQIQKDAVDFTKFSVWRAELLAKITWVSDKFDPRDGFYFSFNGGVGLQFLGSLEQGLKDSFNGVRTTFSGNDDIFGFKRFSTRVGAEVGYQRIGIFYKQFFNSIFDSEKVSEKKICSFPFCLGISFDLL